MYEVNLSEKKKRMLNAIRLWCFTEDLAEITDNENYFTDITSKIPSKQQMLIKEFYNKISVTI